MPPGDGRADNGDAFPIFREPVIMLLSPFVLRVISVGSLLAAFGGIGDSKTEIRKF